MAQEAETIERRATHVVVRDQIDARTHSYWAQATFDIKQVEQDRPVIEEAYLRLGEATLTLPKDPQEVLKIAEVLKEAAGKAGVILAVYEVEGAVLAGQEVGQEEKEKRGRPVVVVYSDLKRREEEASKKGEAE
jgi:hypothetical protein